MPVLDDIEIGFIWNRLVSIANEITVALVRTSFSPNVRESYDLSCMLFDAAGRSLAQGDFSVPSFTGTAPRTVVHMLQRFPPDTLNPGDVLITNDPWQGTGHIYDVNVLRPIFRKGRIVAYSLSITHLPDIGGLGFSTTARSVFEEGMRIPICKIVERGETNEFLLEMIRHNVRTPGETVGDVIANITCTAVGEKLLLDCMDEFNLDDLSEVADRIIALTANAMVEKIRTLPEGRYAHRINVEGDDQPLLLGCEVTIKNGAVAVDFAGTSPCVGRGVNVPLCYSSAFAAYAIKCITTPATPNNYGNLLPISVTAPEGCILNAQPPSPTGGRHSVGHFVTSLVFGALAQAAPNLVQADSGMMNLLNLQGRHRNGEPISSIYYSAGGFGAMQGLDGLPTLPSPSNMLSTPIEVWENLTATTFLYKRLRVDSGGAGEYRGGLGQEYAIRNDTGGEITIASFAMRTSCPALGFNGGLAGERRECRVDGEAVQSKAKHTLRPAQVFTTYDAGGGGFGAPAKRSHSRIRKDVLDGYVSREAALRDYGAAVE